MQENLVWATGYNVVALPCNRAVFMPLSTIIVATNARRLAGSTAHCDTLNLFDGCKHREPVSVRRARTIEDLYEAVAAYDLVLTTDAPLSLALNRRIDTPRIGTFAATPRMLASGEFRPRDERTLFLQLVDETDLRWKHAAHLLENVLGCWEETGDLRAILEYETFDTAGTRSVLDAVEAAESAQGPRGLLNPRYALRGRRG